MWGHHVCGALGVGTPASWEFCLQPHVPLSLGSVNRWQPFCWDTRERFESSVWISLPENLRGTGDTEAWLTPAAQALAMVLLGPGTLQAPVELGEGQAQEPDLPEGKGWGKARLTPRWVHVVQEVAAEMINLM